MEIWKDIAGYENKYQVSNYGRVRNIYGKGKILKPWMNDNGYLLVTLSKDGIRKKYRVHRLVAQAFIPNPDNLETVDHIDSNKTNNHIDNLQWLSGIDNTRKAFNDGLHMNHEYENRNYRYVINLTTNNIYRSLAYAEHDTGVNRANIAKCCNHIRKTAGGYEWQYYDEYLAAN